MCDGSVCCVFENASEFHIALSPYLQRFNLEPPLSSLSTAGHNVLVCARRRLMSGSAVETETIESLRFLNLQSVLQQNRILQDSIQSPRTCRQVSWHCSCRLGDDRTHRRGWGETQRYPDSASQTVACVWVILEASPSSPPRGDHLRQRQSGRAAQLSINLRQIFGGSSTS